MRSLHEVLGKKLWFVLFSVRTLLALAISSRLSSVQQQLPFPPQVRREDVDIVSSTDRRAHLHRICKLAHAAIGPSLNTAQHICGNQPRLEVGPHFRVNSSLMKWICTKCWTIMPRAVVEVLAAADGNDPGIAHWICSSCSAIGHFASDSSDEWGQFANDLVFDAYAAHLQNAGYEVDVYSQECDYQDHDHCPGKNRLRIREVDGLSKETIASFERCWCLCHKTLESNSLEPRERSDDDTVG